MGGAESGKVESVSTPSKIPEKFLGGGYLSYECRWCRRFFRERVEAVVGEMALVAEGQSPAYKVHECGGGRFGIADLRGGKAEEVAHGDSVSEKAGEARSGRIRAMLSRRQNRGADSRGSGR